MDKQYGISGNSGKDGSDKWNPKGRGRATYDANPEVSNLRKPKQLSNDNNSVEEVVRKSVLSADAVEFVPKGISAPVPQQVSYVPRSSAVQDRLNIARQAQNVPQVMVQRKQQEQQFQPYQYPGCHNAGNVDYYHSQLNENHGLNAEQVSRDFADENFAEDEYMSNLVQLQNAMRTLTMNPGRFDSLVCNLVDGLSPYFNQQAQCQEIFNMILQQSITEVNFRYSGARLCTHLDLITSAPDRLTSVFRTTLIEQCKAKVDDQSQKWTQMTNHTADEEKRCHGLIFFLAELVTQMEPATAAELGKQFIKLISTVLKNPAPTSTKTICQALKLAGHTLERDNSGNRAEMEGVMRTLSELVIKGPADSSIRNMVNSVTELRSGNWGQVITNHAPMNNETNQSGSRQVANEPTFYGPDGQELTEEESRFLEEYAYDEEFRPQALWENDEDEIIAEAYEEFLRFQPNSTQKENEKNVASLHTAHIHHK